MFNITKILLLGLVIRVFLALVFHGSFDVDNAYYFADLLLCGKNIYVNSSYNYTPVWSLFLYLINSIHFFSGIPFYFLIKIPAIIADLIIIYFVFRLTFLLTKNNITSTLASLVYALNPVSLIITSLHGQFDSIPLAFILASIYYLIISNQNIILSAVSIGTAIAFKSWPVVFLPLILYQLREQKKRMFKILIWSVLISFISLFPYLLITPQAVIENVFMYRGTRDFGISQILFFLRNNHLYEDFVDSYFSNSIIIAVILLIISYLIYTKKKFSLLKGIIITFLFFYIFSASLGAQYLVWIIPFLVIDNLKWAIFYSLVSALALFTSYLDHQSKALLIHPSLKINLFKYYLPFGIILSLWWLSNIGMLLFYLFGKSPNKLTSFILKIKVSPISLNVSNLSHLFIYLFIIISLISGFLLFLPKTSMCEDKNLEYYTSLSFK